MILEAWLSIWLCLVALFLTATIVRRDRASLGLPFAYMVSLLLIHVPGAYAYAATNGSYTGLLSVGNYVAEGIILATIGAWCYVIGLMLARRTTRRQRKTVARASIAGNKTLLLFCVLSGWFLVFVATPLQRIPTIGAIANFGGAIWMLGVMLGLSQAVQRRDARETLMWGAALLVYPINVLMFGGFLSYGSTAVIIVLSLILVHLRRSSTVIMAVVLGGYIGICIFVNYFDSRDDLRSVVWSGAGTEARIGAVADTFSDFRLFSSDEPAHLRALSARLNQNEFVGIARDRIISGEVDFLYGRSFVEGLTALVPRAIWPSKPVYGGSPAVVTEMTGLYLSRTTSWGVGNVMEFYINFGMASLVICFVILGWLIGWLDFKCYRELAVGRPGTSFLYFLPCVALIQPNGSMVELVGGAVSALLAGYTWRFLWNRFVLRRTRRMRRAPIPALSRAQ